MKLIKKPQVTVTLAGNNEMYTQGNRVVIWLIKHLIDLRIYG